MAKCNIFYSWQSDRKETKKFISKCLNKLQGKTVDYVLYEVKRDTEGVAGSPNIGATIFERIDSADVFIADVTVISSFLRKRPTPNPNVMIELGYAIKTLGWERIILLQNTDHGGIDKLPFDINHQRVAGLSLKGDLDNAKSEIIGKINKTVKLLNEKNMLHGGEPKVFEAKRELEELLTRNMQLIYDLHCSRIKDREVEVRPIVITDNYFEDAVAIKSLLTVEQFHFLTQLLTKMKFAETGDEDHYGWEYAEEIIKLCCEDVFVEYCSDMPDMPMQQTLSRDFVELYNAVVSEDKKITYSAKRVIEINGEVVTVMHVENEHIAYDEKGNLLCKFKREEDGSFSGYKTSHEYEGFYSHGVRHGEGKEFEHINRNTLEYGRLAREGTWENGNFVNGKICGVLLIKDDSQYKRITYGDDEYTSVVHNRYIRDIIDEDIPDKCNQYFVADMTYQNGEYDIIEETLEPLCLTLGGRFNTYCDGCKHQDAKPM